jgi:hypothetical protein
MAAAAKKMTGGTGGASGRANCWVHGASSAVKEGVTEGPTSVLDRRMRRMPIVSGEGNAGCALASSKPAPEHCLNRRQRAPTAGKAAPTRTAP